MPVHQNVECPKCGSTIGFGVKVVNENVTCPSCNLRFHYDDGLLTRLSKLPFGVIFVMPIRMGFIQTGKASIHLGEMQQVKFQRPFHQVSAIFFTDDKGKLMEFYEDNEMVASPIEVGKTGFRLISSKKNLLKSAEAKEVDWWAAGSETDELVPVWHIFLQNAIDLIRKEEYAAAIVASIMSFDAYLAEILVTGMRQKALSRDFIKRTILSERHGRNERLSIWLQEFFGKKFTESPYNDSLKRASDLRNKIVHPSVDGFDERSLTPETTVEVFTTVIKSMKWISDLKRGAL